MLGKGWVGGRGGEEKWCYLLLLLHVVVFESLLRTERSENFLKIFLFYFFLTVHFFSRILVFIKKKLSLEEPSSVKCFI